jgi:uncharacterized protein (UPF0210 family)
LPSREHVLATVRMLQEEHLDVRAVTLGVDLCDCADRDPQRMCRLIREKILRKAGNLVEVCEQVSRKYGIPVVNRRLAVSPVANIAAGHGHDEMLRVAQTLDGAAEEAGVDFVGGYSAMVQKGLTDSERTLIETLPDALSMTSRVCASVNAASSRAGINVDALLLLGERILQTAAKTAERDGFGCCKLVVFANIPEDNPFMAGGFKGPGEPETVVNVGVSGPGVVKRAIERLRESGVRLSLADIAEEIKNTSFRVTRTGELIGREVARLTGAEFGIVDLSLAPTPEVGGQCGRDPSGDGRRAHRRSGLDCGARHADGRRQEGRNVRVIVGGRAFGCVHPRGGGQRPGFRGNGGQPDSGEAGGDDQRLLRGTGYGGGAGRSVAGDHRRHHRR